MIVSNSNVWCYINSILRFQEIKGNKNKKKEKKNKQSLLFTILIIRLLSIVTDVRLILKTI